MTGTAIRELRRGLGWSQSQMACFLCCHSQGRVSVMEQRNYRAKGTTLKLLRWLLLNMERAIVDGSLLREPKLVDTERFFALRAAKNMTQEQFGAFLGIKTNYVCKLENGNRKIGRRLSRLLSLL